MRSRMALLALVALGGVALATSAYDEYDGGFGYDEYDAYGYDYYDYYSMRFGDYYEDFYGDGYGYYGYQGFGYDMDYLGYDSEYYYDYYGYYGDEYAEYYDYYGYYGDVYGDDYTWEYEEWTVDDCILDDKGKPVIDGTIPVCDLKLSGADGQLDSTKLQGGVDGKYKVTGCFNGRPMYTRQGSPAGEERVLWFSAMFGDWDISPFAEPDEDNIIVYGGGGLEEERPNFVEGDAWAVATFLTSTGTDSLQEYVSLPLEVECQDGKALKAPEVDAFGRTPFLTNDELEEKYKYIYQQYSPKDQPTPSINFTSVVFMVMIGAAVLLGIPYIMFKKRPSAGGKSFAQMLEHSRKKRSGHTL